MVTPAELVILTYAIPLMPAAPMSNGRLLTLWRAGAGDGEESKTRDTVAVPPVVAGNPTDAERPLLLGGSGSITGAAPTVTDAVVEAGSVGEDAGEAVGRDPIGLR